MADCFVIMDTFQYTKTGVTHRNKIRTNTGSGYLTIPITKDFRTAAIKDVELPADRKWEEIHWQTIYRNYLKAEFFGDHEDFFKSLYQKDFRYLSVINIEIIRYLLQCFNINVEIILASELNLSPNLTHTDMIIAIMERLDAETYISGPSGRKYMEFDKLKLTGLNLKFAAFNHPVYKQRYPGFVPNMAAIDLLFNVGPQSKQIIRSSGRIDS